MADTPQCLTLKKHRDSDRPVERWARRVLVGAIVLLAALALFNVFGQHPVTTTARGEGATLEVFAPEGLRGGVYYMGRFEIAAERELEHATLVLDEGWLDSMHINTIEPAPAEEESRDGRLALDFGPVPAGDSITAYLQFQVNPTNIGRRSQGVGLYDGDELLTDVERTVTIYP